MSDQAPVLDPRERYHDQEELLRAALDSLQVRLWTSIPAVVTRVRLNGDRAMTVDVQIVIRMQTVDNKGEQSFEDRKELLDLPIFFPQGGGFILTFPIQPGDEGDVIFSCRNFDAWWQSGGTSNVEPVLRGHSLADGKFYPGLRSQARPLADVSEATAQLRDEAGTTYFEVDGAGNANVVAAANVTAQAGGDATVNAQGNIAAVAGGHINVTATGQVNMTGSVINLN